MQRELLKMSETKLHLVSFRHACAQFAYSVGLGSELVSTSPSDLACLAVGGHPDAKRLLSIRASVSRSLKRLEERGLVMRLSDHFTVTADGAMEVLVNADGLTVSNEPVLSVNADTLTVSNLSRKGQ